ncbi:hypothetical protein D3C72_1274000 [compost metagenome]
MADCVHRRCSHCSVWGQRQPRSRRHSAELRQAGGPGHPSVGHRPSHVWRQRADGHAGRRHRQRCHPDARALPGRGPHCACRCHCARHPVQRGAARSLEQQGHDARRWWFQRLHSQRARQCVQRPGGPAHAHRPWLRHLCQRLGPPGQCLRIARRHLGPERRGRAQLWRRRAQENPRRSTAHHQGPLRSQPAKVVLCRRLYRRARGAGRHPALARGLGRCHCLVPGVERCCSPSWWASQQHCPGPAWCLPQHPQARAGLPRRHGGVRCAGRRVGRPHQRPAAMQCAL